MRTHSTLRLARLAQLVAFTLLGSGCYTTTVYSGKPAAPASMKYDEKWHHSAVLGIAEISGPYDLSSVCPQGWSEITTETSLAAGFVDVVTGSMYSPQTITVRCALPQSAASSPKAP